MTSRMRGQTCVGASKRNLARQLCCSSLRADTVIRPLTANSYSPSTKRLTPLPDGVLLEDDESWSPGSKTIEQRTLELLDEGYALISTRIDGSRLFERRTVA